jgi:hypothetical protein
MILEPPANHGQTPAVPRPEQTRLTPDQARRLREAEAKIEGARRRWAAEVRRYGIAAAAREYGITSQALSERVRRIEAAAEEQ